MRVNPDFRDLIAALNEAGAEFMLIGGHAIAFHVAPRFTKDFDVWVRATTENAHRVMAALVAFGAPLTGISVTDFATSDTVFMMGVPPNRIDVLTSIDAVSFDEAWPARIETTYADQRLFVISRAHLLTNKLACGRPQDLLDAEALRDSPAD